MARAAGGRSTARGMDCVVVTGLSGAGKTSALRALEDMGYFCVDNLPLPLLPSLLRLYRTWGHRLTRIAVGVDVRTGLPARVFRRSLADLRKEGIVPRVVFMDADNTTLFRRFSETRRRHPLGGTVSNGIRRERRILHDVMAEADKIIDSSHLTPGEVKEMVLKTLNIRHPRGMAVVVTSFGYKHGVPLDADVVWDVRFLPNPNYVPRLRPLTGESPAVSKFVLENPMTKKFLGLLDPLQEFLLDRFAQEGKSYVTLAVGCTGGRHRSVAIAENLAARVRRQGRFEVRVHHRDAAK
ncbi:MAG TPA: RNase adapter RapZ [Elusimicrobiota bacterium]|nr:RNase adapter RapZ [Elusimicrobiota bacterium]HMX42652.1 RNase adapter RapZ [Elusimicrobiota bacterium]HMX93936.1 RNase adapter RapZ [Elusimicrobiota bacterium]HMZ27397.1 RNase adapter RapZ [Elusimicrobiota bacterium]HND64369.1 RNase adapter RapZ [Elusimicrobiota bacterium]